LAAAVTDETGTGSLVFATSPTLVTPILGTPQSGDFSSGTFTWPTFNQNTTGNAATATSATTATNLAGGATGSLPYQSAAATTAMLAAGSNGQVLTLASGVPSWATPTTGTVTSVSGTGTVSGISLSGTVTSTGNLTLGGTLDLSAPPTIGNTTPNTGRFTTLTVDDNSTFGTSNTDTVTFTGRINSDFDPATDNAYDLGRVGHEWRDLFIDGTANIDSLIADTADINAGTIDGVTIGAASAAAATVTTLNVTSTIALSGSTGTTGYVLTSNGASAPTWQANASGLAITDDTTTNATRFLTFTSASTGSITGADVSSTKLAFNPSTGALTATSLTPTNALGVAYGGTGATTLTGVLKGNGTSAFTAATAGTDYVAPGTATTFTALQTFAGTSSNADLKTSNILEVATVSATAATGTIDYDVTTQSVLYYTTDASGNFTVNFRGSSGTSLDTIMATGESLSATFLVTNGASAYYNSAVQVDGSSVTPKWQGGSAPTSGNASSIDSYTYVIIKTASATFTVLASVTKFA
jgi:hypothetical protein